MFDFMIKDALGRTYGWRPREVDKMDSQTIQAVLRIISGMNKRQEFELRRKHG